MVYPNDRGCYVHQDEQRYDGVEQAHTASLAGEESLGTNQAVEYEQGSDACQSLCAIDQYLHKGFADGKNF